MEEALESAAEAAGSQLKDLRESLGEAQRRLDDSRNAEREAIQRADGLEVALCSCKEDLNFWRSKAASTADELTKLREEMGASQEKVREALHAMGLLSAENLELEGHNRTLLQQTTELVDKYQITAAELVGVRAEMEAFRAQLIQAEARAGDLDVQNVSIGQQIKELVRQFWAARGMLGRASHALQLAAEAMERGASASKAERAQLIGASLASLRHLRGHFATSLALGDAAATPRESRTLSYGFSDPRGSFVTLSVPLAKRRSAGHLSPTMGYAGELRAAEARTLRQATAAEAAEADRMRADVAVLAQDVTRSAERFERVRSNAVMPRSATSPRLLHHRCQQRVAAQPGFFARAPPPSPVSPVVGARGSLTDESAAMVGRIEGGGAIKQPTRPVTAPSTALSPSSPLTQTAMPAMLPALLPSAALQRQNMIARHYGLQVS